MNPAVGLVPLDTLQHVFDDLVETFPLLGSQLDKLHAEVIAGLPGDRSLLHFYRLFEGREVYTQCQYCSTLYMGPALNGPAP